MSSTISAARGTCQKRLVSGVRPFGRAQAVTCARPLREAILCRATESETATASEGMLNFLQIDVDTILWLLLQT